MSECLKDIEGVDTYIDDIILYNHTWEDHKTNLRKVFARMEEAKLVINLAKSDFCQAEISYLGHIIGYGVEAEEY